MAIRKHVSWDGKKYRGYVDLGNDAEVDDSAPVAKDALVFMVVGLNKSWKVPVGYFFIDGLSGLERANLVKLCIKKLHDVGVDVISLVCDGPSCHFAMLRALGANMTPPQLHPYFTHPLDKTKRVYIFLDFATCSSSLGTLWVITKSLLMVMVKKSVGNILLNYKNSKMLKACDLETS